MGLLLLIFLAVSVKEDQTPLRAGCAPDATLVAALPAGTEIKLRYALSGESVPCYKVAANLEGKQVEGYLPASALDGLDAFTKSRQQAGWVEVKATPAAQPAQKTGPSPPPAPPAPTDALIVRGGAAAHAGELMEEGRYAEALAILDDEIRKRPKDAALLALAGHAAWRNDDNRGALEYFRKSLDLEPNPKVQAFVKQLQKEFNTDQSNAKLYGIRVALRFDSDSIPVETARQVVGVIDETLADVGQRLGCFSGEKVITIAQTWEAYRSSVGYVEWSGGVYDGRIRVPMDKGKGMDAKSRRTLAHEATHACLNQYQNVPGWLNEGLAQTLSGDIASPASRKAIASLAKEGKLPKLAELGGGWGGLSSEQARLAYTEALIATEILIRDFGNDGVRNILRNPERIQAVAVELDKRLGGDSGAR